MVEISALKLIYKTNNSFFQFFLDIFVHGEARQVCQANVMAGFFLAIFFSANFFSTIFFIVSFLAKPIFIYG